MRRTFLRQVVYKTSTFILLTFLIISGLSFNLAVSHADNLSISTATNCDNNAVVYCGAASVDSLINKYSKGDGLNSAASIQHIYSYFGITASDIKGMDSDSSNETVAIGAVNKSENVYDSSGKLVAHSAMTAGRIEGQNTADNLAESYDGTNFFVRPPKDSFATDTLQAYLVTINGQFAFAILASCGNPVIATPEVTPTPKPKPTPKPVTPAAVKPAPVSYCSGDTVNVDNGGVASQGGNCSQNTTIVESSPVPYGQCTSLSFDITNNNPLTISATANPNTGNGAQLGSVVFDFGDGTVTPPSEAMTQSHTYATARSYTIIATLNFSASGGQSVPNAICEATLPVSSPPIITTVSTPPTPVVQAQPASNLVNTGPGDDVALFGVTSLVSMVGYRIFLGRRH